MYDYDTCFINLIHPPFLLVVCDGWLKKILLVMMQRHSGLEGWHGMVINFAIGLAAIAHGWNV